MEISFPDDQLQSLFERRSSLEAQFGFELAKLICCYMGVLREAKRLSAVPTCCPIDCRSEGNGCYSIALADGHRLAFQPASSKKTSGDRNLIREIRILGVTVE